MKSKQCLANKTCNLYYDSHLHLYGGITSTPTHDGLHVLRNIYM